MASSDFSAVCAGAYNTASGPDSFVGGGENNTASGFKAMIGGGDGNNATADFATVAGGTGNGATGPFATTAGGNGNQAITNFATVSGGDRNRSSGAYSTVAGGGANVASGRSAFVGGGGGQDNLGAGPYTNVASGDWSVISGGWSNIASAASSVVGGGALNIAGGSFAAIAGGEANTIAIGQYATIGGGLGNRVTNYYATIPGGAHNLAGGIYSFAAGQNAQALHQGSFVWADSQNAVLASSGNDQFLIRAASGVGINKNNPAATLDVDGTLHIQGVNNWDVTGTEGDFRVGNDSFRFKIGVANAGSGAGDVWMRAHGGTGRVFLKTPGGTTIYSNEGQTTGVTLAAGSSAWSSGSDRNTKENFIAVDTREVLERVASLPLTSWNYKSQEKSIRHIGPMAQDFASAFQVGEDDKHITTVDEGGVALAAIQGLNQKLEYENAELKRRIEKLEKLVLNQKPN